MWLEFRGLSLNIKPAAAIADKGNHASGGSKWLNREADEKSLIELVARTSGHGVAKRGDSGALRVIQRNS